MPRTKLNSISFDAMVKFFMQHYGIATQKDMERILARLDHLEMLLSQSRQIPIGRKISSTRFGRLSKSSHISGSDTVLKIIKKAPSGVSIKEIMHQVNFDEKKLRNIIYRLDKLGKIRRITRGVYTLCS